MDPETENFDRLLKLLALKRHEQPRPGYFEQLPREVRSRLLAAAAAPQLREERLVDDTGWVGRLLNRLQAQPIIAGLASAAFCGFIIVAIVLSERMPSASSDSSLATTFGGSAIAPGVLGGGTNSTLSPLDPQLPSGIFDGGLLNNRSQPADYRPPGQ